MAAFRKKRLRILAGVAVCLLALTLLWLFLQFGFPHRLRPFLPDYPQVDLAPILAKESLSAEDYQTLYAQTGLGTAAIDDLRDRGRSGLDQILETQAAFFRPPNQGSCSPLGVTTREHRFLDGDGRILYAVPLAPLKEGDVILSFSTHTAGWTHGHAGLVIDPKRGVTLESVVLGSPSGMMDLNHWRSYTTMMVIRPRADDDTRRQVVELAQAHLVGIPYSLVSGVFGEKFQPLEGAHSAHCGYLPWYAWMAVGVDLDADGGRVAAPLDLAMSGQADVVQIYGIDPAQYPLKLGDPALPGA